METIRDSKGKFMKGSEGHLGYKNSLETNKKISLANKGKKAWNKGKRKYEFVCLNCKKKFKSSEKKRKYCSKSCSSKHKIRTQEQRDNISKANIGKIKSKETRRKLSEAHIGKLYSEETRKKMGESRKGEKHWNYHGGVTPINEKIRHSFEYKLWRKSVFERDNYTCRFCGKRGVTIHADHIKPFALYPELRFAIDNGRTLCIGCHRKTDTWGGIKSG